MIRSKDVEFNPYGVTISDISRGTHIPVGEIGLSLLQGDKEFLSKFQGTIKSHLSADQKRAALHARAKGLIGQKFKA